MAKGSQLQQLKSALSQVGVVGNNQNGKKRKRTTPQEKDKAKRAAKLEEIQRKLNPFDTKVTKLKHDVGGRKLKGVVGKPAQSKMAGIEQRKKTLLKEWEDKNHAGGVTDRRFGENDPTMSLEERMLERFTKERQRASRGSLFNLEDEDELTHYGQSLSKLDDFDNAGLGLDEDDDEEEDGQLDKDVVKHTHFGGFDDEEDDEDESEEPARKKSKAEVMAEVIAKSKEHKMLRQMEREHRDNVRHELDQAFDSLQSLLYAPDPSSADGNAASTSTAVDASSESVPVLEKKSDYDQAVRELAFEKRAKPKDRTKTEEELALEEKEALEKAERRRRKRMLGLDESDSEEEGQSRAKRKRGGDDLEDDFDDEEIGWTGLGAGLGDEGNAIDDNGDEEEDEDEEDEEDDDDDDEGGEGVEDDFEDDDESTDSEAGAEQEELISSSKKPSKKARTSKSSELPFTFPCPSSHDEFLDIVDGVEDKDVPTVVHRIRALHHTSLAPENKFKLQTFTGVLIDHILYLASPSIPHFSVINTLLPHLFALTRAYPIQSAEHFVRKLSIMHKNLRRGLSRGALVSDAKTWPGTPELALLRVIGVVWPTSDMNHIVVSPARVLMGAYLGLSRVRGLKDIASGLFLCTLFLQYEQLSQRFIPEVVNFLINSVFHFVPNGYNDVTELPGSFPSPDFRSALCRPLALNLKKAKEFELQKPDLAAILLADEHDEADKLSLFGLTLELLGRYANLYKGLDAFIEIFEPISEALQKLDSLKLPVNLQDRINSSSEMITRLLKFSRQSRRPLLLQAHKPIPIPSYIPKFESHSSSYLRHQDPDRERNEAAKLRNEYKKERKGAIRELRKDARFLAGVEQAKQKEKDRSYNDRMKRVFGSIEGERAEQKAMEREKAKEKRRSGRK